MNEEEYFEQLCSNSVDGTLTDSEKQKLEEHLAECPSCAALKEDLEQMHSMLAVDETEPPAGLHDSIMERLRQEETVRVVAPQKPMRRLPVFTMVAAAALAVNVVTFGVQGADLASIENSYLTAAELVPSYGLMVCAFGVLGMAGIGLDAVELWSRRVRLSVGRAAGAAVLVLAGIFVMRFAFYMMHMTVGLGV